MPTFGHRLRHERESRNTPIQEVSARTHIGLRYLEALENNDFDALPGPRGFAKLYIRAYADLLGFDPQAMIEEFEKERRRQAQSGETGARPERPRRRRIRYEPRPQKRVAPPTPAPARAVDEPVISEEAVETAAPEPPPVEAPAPEPVVLEPRPRARVDIRLAIAALAAITIVALIVTARWPEPAPIEPASLATPAPERTAGPVSEPVIDVPAAPHTPDGLRVAESGVGTSVVDLQLVGETARFDAGATAVFLTRVVDGRGETLRHVWLHEGNVIQTRELAVGSPDWRTYSTKTLWKQGRWTVEARRADDRVVARAEFTCSKP